MAVKLSLSALEGADPKQLGSHALGFANVVDYVKLANIEKIIFRVFKLCALKCTMCENIYIRANRFLVIIVIFFKRVEYSGGYPSGFVICILGNHQIQFMLLSTLSRLYP